MSTIKTDLLSSFTSYPKPVPKEKVKKGIAKVSNKAKFTCSDGTKVSQAYINRKLSEIGCMGMCEAYPIFPAMDKDHTIPQATCKNLHKTELIWDTANIAFSSRAAHMEWQSYAKGRFEDHANVVERMLYVKKHDPETFIKRKMCISNYKVLKAIS